MTVGESPTFARRRVRLALREAREAARKTQSEVAEAMEWSLSKVIRIEGGEVSISPNDLRPLLAYLGIKDKGRIDSLLDDAKASRARTRQWWTEPKFRDHLTSSLARLIELEAEAAAIRYFYMNSFPGPLQVPEYARAVLERWHDDLSPDEFQIRLEARRRRREQLLKRTDSPLVLVLLDESLLLRPVGGVATLATQWTDMVRLSREGRLIMRILPFDTDDVPLPSGPSYDLLYLGQDDDEEDAFIYRENGTADEIVEDAARASTLRATFDKLWDAAINEDDTIALVHTRLRSLGDTAARS